MAKIPQSVIDAWEKREKIVIFSTVDGNSVPNSIYATCVRKYDDETIVIADNYFNKTRKNIDSGTKGSLLFITGDKKAFQLKGNIEYHTSGPVFEDMKKWNPEEHPGRAAAALRIEEIFNGAEKIL